MSRPASARVRFARLMGLGFLGGLLCPVVPTVLAVGPPRVCLVGVDASDHPHLEGWLIGAPAVPGALPTFSPETLRLDDGSGRVDVTPDRVETLESTGGLDLAVVIEASSRLGEQLIDLRRAAVALVDGLGSSARVWVVAYDSASRVVVRGARPAAVRAAVEDLRAEGNGAVRTDALDSALSLLESEGQGRHRAVVLLADGGEDGGSRSIEEVREHARRSGAALHSLTLPSPEAGAATASLQPSAPETEGCLGLSETVTEPQELEQRGARLGELLLRTARVRWTAHRLPGDGQVHPVQVRWQLGGQEGRGVAPVQTPVRKSRTLWWVLAGSVGLLAAIGLVARVRSLRNRPPPPVPCRGCGEPLESAWSTCSRCATRAAARLRVVEGPHAGRELAIVRDRSVLGTALDCELVVQDGRVSSHHCCLSQTEAGIEVSDLRSTNGTFVNGRRVHSRVLTAGDRLSVGDTHLEFESGPSVATSPAIGS